MTQPLQSALQAAIQQVTRRTTQDFNGDLHDLCDLYSVPAAPISGRAIGVATVFDPSITTASAALNYLQANPTTVAAPRWLFSSGQQGAWYDPSDLTTLFQDSAGTTPVTTVEQPVGLMLDKSKGLVLGPELVTNGDFSQGATGWSLGTAWSVSGGQAVHTATGSADGLNTTFATPLTGGKYYKVTFTVTAVSSGTFYVQFTGGGGDVFGPANYSAPGTYTFYRQANGANTGFRVTAENTFTGSIDNISVKELPGNHAFQSTSASRPTLRARYNLLTRSEEFNDAAWTKSNVTVTANAAVAPDGTTTADKFVEDTSNSTHTITVAPGGLSGTNTLSIYAKAAERSWLIVRFEGLNAWFDLTNGTVGTVDSGITAAISNAGSGWYRCFVTRTVAGAGAGCTFRLSTGNNIDTYTGNGTSGILIWGAQLVPTAVFPSNTYQRIGAATDYATGAAFPPYLFFDGIDDSMLTNSVDFATVTSDGQARRNLLNNPTQFDVTTSWTTDNATVTANTGTAPDGTTTADTLTSSGAALVQRIRQAATQTGQVTFSVYAKAGTAQFLQLLNASDGNCFANFDLSAGTVGTAGTGSTSTISNAGSGWYRCTITYTLAASTNWQIYISPSASATYGQAFTATVAALQLWGAQLETGSTATAFQNIGTDKMLVVAGVTKQSDLSEGVVTELSANKNLNAGSFYLFAPEALGASGNFTFCFRGSVNSGFVASATTLAPVTRVVSGLGDIAANSQTIRTNGVAVTNSPGMGTGNYGNYPLYIGRRGGTTFSFNGNLYSLVIAGQSYSSGQISSTESWVAAKTPLGTI